MIASSLFAMIVAATPPSSIDTLVMRSGVRIPALQLQEIRTESSTRLRFVDPSFRMGTELEIPMSEVLEIRETPWFGFEWRSMRRRGPSTVEITAIDSSCRNCASLMVGDQIISVAGAQITDDVAGSDIDGLIGRKADSVVLFEFQRRGNRFEVPLKRLSRRTVTTLIEPSGSDGSTVRYDPPTGSSVASKPKPRSGLKSMALNIAVPGKGLLMVGAGYRSWKAKGGWSIAMITGEIEKTDVSGASANLYTLWPLWVGNSVTYLSVGYQGLFMSMSMPDPFTGADTKIQIQQNIFYAAAGKEWRFGIRKNWGFALELGVQGGNAESKMKFNGASMSSKSDVDPSPHFGANGAYYF